MGSHPPPGSAPTQASRPLVIPGLVGLFRVLWEPDMCTLSVFRQGLAKYLGSDGRSSCLCLLYAFSKTQASLWPHQSQNCCHFLAQPCSLPQGLCTYTPITLTLCSPPGLPWGS